MLIRKAQSKDIAAIVTLAKTMIEYHHRLDPYYRAPKQYKHLEADLESELEDSDGLMLIAEQDGKVAGYFRGAVEDAPAYAAPDKIGVVYDLVVSPEARRKKIGERIFKKAADWFSSRRAKEIELSVDARNSAGVAFWKKQGFFEYKIRMRLDLPK